MGADKVKVGVIGTGSISGAYLGFMTKVAANLEVVACADLERLKAETKAAEFGVPKVCSVEELLADPEIEIVVNLTIPSAHYDVAKAALAAGKSVHNEKPFTITREEGKELLALAKQKGVLVGSAPDTFMGAGGQTCRKLIDDGEIGEPVGCTAFMMGHGHESWHPAPEFYYKAGGGPMFDMGPYYVTALVNLLGPVRRVTGATRITFPRRMITSEPLAGTVIQVEVPTHVVGIMEFANGAIGNIITSFDVWGANLPCIEIYGAEGTLWVPDPNGFGGSVRLKRARGEISEIPLTHQYAEGSRGLGVADMAYALKENRQNRCSGELAYHVCDIMHAFHDASDRGRHLQLESTCEQPAPLPMNPAPGTLHEE